jgi:hypothetical protein
MQPITLAIVDGGAVTAILSDNATEAHWDYGPHGPRALTVTAPRRAAAIFALYRARRVPTVVAIRGGQICWAGRLDTASIRMDASGTQITVQALGSWQALRDGRHTALWSSTRYDTWRPMTTADFTLRDNTAWVTDTDNRLFIGLKNGTTYPSGARVGGLVLELPEGGSRGATGMQFTADYSPSAGFEFGVNIFGAAGWGSPATILSYTPGATGGTRAYHLTFASAVAIEFYLYNTSGAPIAVGTGGTEGQLQVSLLDLRVVSDTSNRINTTLTANAVGGSNVTLTVGSTVGMYVGQQLVIDSGGGSSQMLTVASITDATHLVVASLTWNRPIGTALQGHRVLASTIAPALVAEAAALNPGALSDDLTQIASTALDLTDAVYEDALPADVLDDLAARGDGAGGQIETGVDERGRAYFRPRGSVARTWYVRLEHMELERPISAVENQVYATYEDVSGVRTRRTAVANDTISQADYGLVRVGTVAAKTSNATLAASIRDLALSDRADPQPAASIGIRQIETANGAIVSGDRVRPGDTITIRNLPALSAGTFVDRIRSFTVSEMTYDAMTGRADVVPETPLPLLDVLIAQGLIPS